MKKIEKNGQSILEYTILIAVIIGSLTIMRVYIKRGYQGRLKQDVDGLGQQYSPGHTTSVIETQTNIKNTTCSGGNCWGHEIQPGMSVTQSTATSTLIRQEGVDSFATEK